jgi:hypothetical protein
MATSDDSKGDSLRATAQLTIFRNRGGKIEYLFLKRQNDDGADELHLWQPVSQAIDSDNQVNDDLLREAAAEQAGIKDFKYLSEELSEYEWYADDQNGRDVVFAAEVGDETAIFPDLHRYSEFEWLPFSMALSRLRWSGGKTSLRRLQADLEARL